MNIQILENTPRSLKLRYSKTLESFVVFIFGFILVFIVFLISGATLVQSFMNLGKDWSILIGSLSLFFTVISVLGFRPMLRWMFFSSHACILHFDLTTKKLNCYPQSILRKLPVEEIPFAQLDKIEFKEQVNKDDNNQEYLTYALDLKTKDKSVWSTSTDFVAGGAQTRRHEVEEVARLISKITGIPYTFSTDKPLPEKP